MHRKLVVAAAGTAAIVTAALGPAAYAAPAHPALSGTGVPCSGAALAAAVSSAYHGESLHLSPGCVYKLDDTIYVSKDLTIVGAGATLERASDSSSYSLIQVDKYGDLTVLYTNFRDGGGSGDNYGGAIYVYKADVDVSNSTFTGNTAGDEYGGAIYNDDHTSLTGDTFRQNAADYGAAVYNDDNNPVRVALHHTEVVGNTPDNLENNSSALACGV